MQFGTIATRTTKVVQARAGHSLQNEVIVIFEVVFVSDAVFILEVVFIFEDVFIF